VVNFQPAMVRIDAPDTMVIRRSTVEEQMGRAFDLQELHINLITLTGHINETDDDFTLSWKH
jgi:phenol hydroxylase P2 protein